MKRRLIVTGLVLLTLAAYARVVDNGFINYDDSQYITANIHVLQGLSLRGARWAFTATEAANWHPLTWLSHMTDTSLFGGRPGGHHLVSLLLHAANTALLFLVLSSLTGTLWPAAFVSALFAVHPLHVESVAWAAERKDVLSAFFWMAALALYLHHARRPRMARLLAVALALALGLMAKPMLVSLPLVLLLLDYWPLGRLGYPGSPRSAHLRRLLPLLLEKTPLFALAAGSSLVTYLAQKKSGALALDETFPLGVRASNALVAYVGYMVKMLWPRSLIVHYPHPGRSIAPWSVAAACLVLVAVTALAMAGLRRRPWFAVGWLWYLITLLPVIGLIQVGTQAMADRYTYLPLIGPFLVLSWGAAGVLGRWPRRTAAALTAAGTILAVLVVLTRIQVGYWRNTVTLFSHVLEVTQHNHVALNMLGANLYQEGKTDEAISCYLKALRLRPGYGDARFNLGLALAGRGDGAEAKRQFEMLLRTNPRDAEALFNLGKLLARQGDLDGAERRFREVLDLDPELNEVLRELGGVLARRGEKSAAVTAYRQAVRVDPRDAAAHHFLGILLAENGMLAEALGHLRAAVSLQADDPDLRYDLGKALDLAGAAVEASAEYLQALRLKPDFPEAHNNLGIDLISLGRSAEAGAHFREALRLRPDYPEARANLDRALSVRE